MSGRFTWLITLLMVLAILAGPTYGQSVKINFQPADSDVPEGYLADAGQVFGDQGNGFSYGWDRDITADARARNKL